MILINKICYVTLFCYKRNNIRGKHNFKFNGEVKFIYTPGQKIPPAEIAHFQLKLQQ